MYDEMLFLKNLSRISGETINNANIKKCLKNSNFEANAKDIDELFNNGLIELALQLCDNKLLEDFLLNGQYKEQLIDLPDTLSAYIADRAIKIGNCELIEHLINLYYRSKGEFVNNGKILCDSDDKLNINANDIQDKFYVDKTTIRKYLDFYGSEYSLYRYDLHNNITIYGNSLFDVIYYVESLYFDDFLQEPIKRAVRPFDWDAKDFCEFLKHNNHNFEINPDESFASKWPLDKDLSYFEFERYAEQNDNNFIIL